MARSFNGTSDLIASSSHPVFAINGTYTLACWALVTSFTNDFQTIIAPNDSGNSGIYTRTTGKIAFFWHAAILTSSTVLATSTWAHLAFAGTSTNLANWTCYVNGVSQGTAAGGGPAAITGIQFGYDGVDAHLGGSLQDVGIWNVILTGAEISALANGARPYNIRPLSLISFWPLDGLQSPEPDLSGNAFNGTLTGTAQAFGPPVMQFTPRWPLNSPITQPAVASSFQPAWAIRTRIVVDGIGI